MLGVCSGLPPYFELAALLDCCTARRVSALSALKPRADERGELTRSLTVKPGTPAKAQAERGCSVGCEGGGMRLQSLRMGRSSSRRLR